MIFQHYTTDDLMCYQNLLNARLDAASITQALSHLDNELCLTSYETVNGVSIVVIRSTNDNKLILPINSLVATHYKTVRDWMSSDCMPIICNVQLLREDYPQLHMMSDKLLSLFVYANTQPANKHLGLITFDYDYTAMDLFITGYETFGVAADFESTYVPFNKIKYLVERGLELKQGVCA